VRAKEINEALDTLYRFNLELFGVNSKVLARCNIFRDGELVDIKKLVQELDYLSASLTSGDHKVRIVVTKGDK